MFLDGRVTLHPGDCLAVLAMLPDASIDAVVTDPPYHLTSIVKRFGAENAAPAKSKQTGAFARASRGFMGKTWDGGDIAFRVELWAEVLRVLKPGGHIVAFSGTRTYHRMACAIEDAGFEIRDQAAWCYGSGFPKSHDVSKGIDKAAGYWRGRAGPAIERTIGQVVKGTEYVRSPKEAPVTSAAQAWGGWGTALKPAWEPICLARRPLIGTVAENVLAHGTGALNIDGCRVDMAGEVVRTGQGTSDSIYGGGKGLRSVELGTQQFRSHALGRWPANLLHDGSDEVLAAFPDSSGQQGDVRGTEPSGVTNGIYGEFGGRVAAAARGDSGSAARFFYSSKADADDRIGSKHPTVKPVDLMQWLVRLVCPKGGVVLDPFAGTGTTGEAAWREGCSAILIEREVEYQADIARRMELALAGPDERRRKREALKPQKPLGGLFGGEAA